MSEKDLKEIEDEKLKDGIIRLNKIAMKLIKPPDQSDSDSSSGGNDSDSSSVRTPNHSKF